MLILLVWVDFEGMCRNRQTKRLIPSKQNTLTRANKQAVPKNTGKKAHIKLGPRTNLIPILRKPNVDQVITNTNFRVPYTFFQFEFFSEPTKRVIRDQNQQVHTACASKVLFYME